MAVCMLTDEEASGDLRFPRERSIKVENLLADCNAAELTAQFSRFGAITAVSLGSSAVQRSSSQSNGHKSKSSKVARKFLLIAFEKRAARDQAMQEMQIRKTKNGTTMVSNLGRDSEMTPSSDEVANFSISREEEARAKQEVTEFLDICHSQWPPPEKNSDGSRLKGMKRWLSSYFKERPPAEMLQKKVDSDMYDYNLKEKKEQEAVLQRRNQPDADGFVIVERRPGRKSITRDPLSGATIGASRVDQDRLRKMRQAKEQVLPDFYRFQKRQTRQEELTTLRSKFEQDKKAIESFKASRKRKSMT
mmetsp:Transcript_17387/g.28569  ORF Transcript_17387/g.28569 Transcript_17387/m.28569 type:complete len:305 (-) Transcript_17387:333-1247(-)